MARLSLGRESTPASRVVDLGLVESIPLGEGRAYAIADRAIAVFRPRGGRLYALDDQCPHGGGPLADGMVDGETIVCLLHARRVDLATGRCTDSEACVRVYAAFEVNGRITVVLDGDG